MKFKSLLLCFLVAIPAMVFSQQITKADYERAVGYLWQNVNNKKAFNLYIQPNWFPDSSGLWYINRSKDNKKYLKITLPKLEKSELFDHDKLAAILANL